MNIVVLAGGISTERDVSLVSGTMIYKALKKKGHHVVLLDVYVGYEGNISGIFDLEYDWTENIKGIQETAPDMEHIKDLRKDKSNCFFGPNVIDICKESDIVFMGLHGENGENGKVQAAFDLFDIKYTGTEYLSSALALDKAISKQLFALHGVPTPKGFVLKKGETDQNEVSFPCVVKTCCGGSSVGVYIVHTLSEYQEALANAFTYEDTVIVEEYIKGREFSVGVVEGTAYPIIEIAPIKGFYDYKNKYQAGSAIETCPADLPEDITKEMQKYAEMAFDALKMVTYARMDFRLSEDHKIYCLEANSLPGMTPTSLLPQEAKALGISFEDLCELIITVSLNRYQK